MGFVIRFWGVRGSIACPLSSHLGYGGNTSCVEVVAGNERIIFDAGTGIRLLGKTLLNDSLSHATLLLSHTHHDHIQGFPFFVPIFKPEYRLRIMAGHLKGNVKGYPDLYNALSCQMARPFFPLQLPHLKADITCDEFSAGDSFDLADDLKISTALLNHPDGSVGYRVTYQGHSFVYVTDTEHISGQTDDKVLRLIDGADVVCYDATYTEEEFQPRIGWGHSTWREGVRLAQIAGVKQLVLFHHEPDHDDRIMEDIEDQAKAVWPNVCAAREGFSIVLS